MNYGAYIVKLDFERINIMTNTTDRTDWALLAISGDCSAGAMSDQPTYIPFQKDDFPLISAYLKAQTVTQTLGVQDWFDNVIVDGPGSKKTARQFSSALHIQNELGEKLINQGVFHHKYHKRTDWIIVELDENNYPLNLAPGATSHIGERE
tara:strand:+ start:308 stop:760 length:453 start_codon:yes stop_codon:yes gene_type:complete